MPTANFISVTFFTELRSSSKFSELLRPIGSNVARTHSPEQFRECTFFRRENLPSNASSDGRIRPERFQIKHFFGP